jgi:hypothetical protein
MEKVVGYCGIICSDCPVLVATQKNSDVERKRVADLFTVQYGREYKLEDINCDGCLGDSSRVFKYCNVCEIRQCGKERKVKNCGFCSEYPCEKLSKLFVEYSKARENLDGIRREHGMV